MVLTTSANLSFSVRLPEREAVTAAWQVRAGRHGERDQEALDVGLAIVGWERVPDLSQFETRSALKAQIQALYPQRSGYVIGNWTGQLWRFSH